MFIPLWNRSNYSLLSSLLKVDDIIEYALTNKLDSISLVDNNMFAVMEFIKKCNKHNIKPLIGLEVNLDSFTVLLYAKDYDGYQSLIKLSTIQSERIVNIDDLEKYSNALICILPYQYRNNYNIINQIYSDLYLGYESLSEENEVRIISDKIIFLRLCLYPNIGDDKILYYLYLIRDGKTTLDNMNYDIINHELNYNNDGFGEGIKNTFELSRMCNIVFPTRDNLLPIYDCDNPPKYLFDLCRVGLSKRLGGNIPLKYKDRLTYELKIINDMGFSNYFLVVYDYIKFAKKNGVLVGPGRGSAAGSLVAYSLGITEIDPLKYDLLFERFLNPERKTMPDVDTDFPDDKRDMVIEYVQKKYGYKRVSGIITFGTLALKQVIRDVSRVLNIPLYKVDNLCKTLPNMSHDSLATIYKKNNIFRLQIDNDITLRRMFKIATRIEGFPRHSSQHAAGIIMSRVDLDEVIPLYKIDDMYLSGYTMEYLEELGLLKMDFLVLKNLTLIDRIIKDVKKEYNQDIDFNKIPLDDFETLKVFETANTSGIFQFESSGMKNFLKRLKPTSFEEIFAAIALYRPGAAINIDSYIKRKNKEEKVVYLDKELEEITKNTYGFLIYQEQIMQAAVIYAGYSLGEADILRRAMSKKKVDLLQSEEEKFIRKSMQLNHTKEQAKYIFDLILKFAGYGFNKSHSVVYSTISYKMAYLKCHYKIIFFTNLLTNVIGSEVKTKEYIMEARANNIEIIKPTINNSEDKYIIKNGKIIYPVSNIKGVGTVNSHNIKEAREENIFIDIYDAISRLYIHGITRKVLENLIIADAFRDYSYNRATLIYNLDNLYNYAELTKDIDPSLVIKPEIEYQKEYSDSVILEKEKEVFGFYLSTHPSTIYRKDNPYCINLNEVTNYMNKKVDVLILVEKIRKIKTKKGEEMCFITGSDETRDIEFVLFPKTYKMYEKLNISQGNIIKIRGSVEKRLSEYQIIVEKIKKLEGETNEEK